METMKARDAARAARKADEDTLANETPEEKERREEAQRVETLRRLEPTFGY
jgi:hypothetical protein